LVTWFRGMSSPKRPAGGKDRQRHNAGFPLEKSK
jgi:hypothetical protein